MAYAECGDPGGVPVLFFHGTPGSGLLGALWDDAARQRDLRLLALDRPGYGRSDPWTGRTLADTAGFAGPVLDGAPVESFHGIRDGNVPVEGARELARRLDAALTNRRPTTCGRCWRVGTRRSTGRRDGRDRGESEGRSG